MKFSIILATTLGASFFLFSGCNSATDDTSSGDPVQTNPWYTPKQTATFYWQLQGALNTTQNVEIYDIDLFDTPVETINTLHAQGKKVICYFSAGTYEAWREDANKFDPDVIGNKLDNHNERWLDIRSENVRNIMKDRIALAKAKGCDGVEPDNIDGYTNNPGFSFTAKDQLLYNKLLAQEAHDQNLAIGLKNDLLQINDLVDYFDFALNEQCHEYAGDCEYLATFVKKSKPVFNVEYEKKYINDENKFQELCLDNKERGFFTLVLPQALDGSYVKYCQ
jgi:hypothetical protein